MDTSTQTTLDQSNHQPTKPSQSEGSDADLRLSYQNTIGNTIVIRKYQKFTGYVREIDEEWMYNYMSEQWGRARRFVHEYDLCEDNETLAGDDSNWQGEGRNWRDWFTQRHYERLAIRFQNEETPDSPDEHEQVPSPENSEITPSV